MVLPSLSTRNYSHFLLDERIVKATFKGNPKTVVISCYSPQNNMPEEDIVNFYNKLSNAVKDVPPHAMLIIGGDMNAQVASAFSLHDKTNRNGHHLVDFIQQHNLIIGNTSCMYVCMYRCLVRDTLTTTMDFSGSLMLKMLVKKEKEKSKC